MGGGDVATSRRHSVRSMTQRAACNYMPVRAQEESASNSILRTPEGEPSTPPTIQTNPTLVKTFRNSGEAEPPPLATPGQDGQAIVLAWGRAQGERGVRGSGIEWLVFGSVTRVSEGGRSF